MQKWDRFVFVVCLSTVIVACGIRAYRWVRYGPEYNVTVWAGVRDVPLSEQAVRDLAVETPRTAHHCGIERWPVKTLVDSPFTADVVKDKAIADLVKIPAPSETVLKRAEATRFPEEKKQYTVDALIVGFKAEADQDFHIVLADPKNPKVTMIAEIPAGECAPERLRDQFDGLQRRFIKQFGLPHPKFRRLAKPARVSITGVFFFDFLHGQTGVAPNGAELHPVLDWKPTP